MKFKPRNLREIADMVIGDAEHFPRRSSFFITKFFEECDLDFVHDGTTRAIWASQRLEELLEEPQPAAFQLPRCLDALCPAYPARSVLWYSSEKGKA